MAKINIFVKSGYRNKNNECPIMIDYSHTTSRVRLNTNLKVNPDLIEIIYDHDTDLFKARSITNTSARQNREMISRINGTLKETQDKINQIILEQKQKSESLTASIVKLRLLAPKPFSKSKESIPVTVIDYYTKFVEAKKTSIGSGINSYRSTLTHLKNYIGTEIILFSDLRKAFFDGFLHHLETKGKKGSTIFKQFKNLRIMLNWVKSNDEDDLIKIPNTYKVYKVKSKFADPIGLSIEQFQEFIDKDLSARKELERTRDLFVFGVAMGGLRHGDLRELGQMLSQYGAQRGGVTFFEKKTANEHHEVPFNALSLMIINKYPVFPYVPSNQRMNTNLKEIAKLLEWNAPITIPSYNTKGVITGKKIVELKDIISTKFMRKTAATIDGELNIEPVVSMLRSGHKSLSSYMRYRSTSRKNFENANEKWNTTFNRAI